MNTSVAAFDIEEHNDIVYHPTITRDKARELDLYVPLRKSPSKMPLIVFVHGGAWRAEDKSDHVLLARRLVQATGYPVAVPNYRLTRANQPIKHPEHASDVLSSLSFLTTWHGLLPSGSTSPRLPYDPSRIYVIGHSCGAHIIASILLDSSAAYPKLTPPHPPVGSPSLLDAVQGVVLFEGIHDIDILLQSFPDYGKWFIAETIGPGPLYAEASAINYPLRTHGGKEQGTHIRWLVANSTGDTLIDFKQAEIMVDHLKKLYGAAGEAKVKLDLTTCKLEHKEDLITDEFIELMRAFICEI